jgi:diphosphomevalonate decarboxylase
MQVVRELRAGGSAVFFTIDAGPQVKAVCLPGDVTTVRAALDNCQGVLRTMVSGLGPGARLLEST